MRRLYMLLLTFALISTVYAQNKPPVKTDPKIDKKDTINTSADNKAAEKIPDGYENLIWGMYISDAKDKISGILSYTDEKRIIISKDKELQYYYGFFYKEPSTDPASIKKDDPAAAADKKPETAQEKDEGILFYVSLTFPYLDQEKVYKRITQKYGKHTGENIKNNQGAISWESENKKTVVIMWIDQYEKKPYCRKITYLSKDIAVELNNYTTTIFNKNEIELLKTLNPNFKETTQPEK